MRQELTRKADDRGRVTLGGEFSGKDVKLSIERAVDVDELPTMRAVHFFSPPDWARARLYAGDDHPEADALFGIHWNTGPIWAKSAYENHENPNAKKDYNGMERAADQGALVSSYYGVRKENLDQDDPYHLNDYIQIGICPPGASVQAIPFEYSDGTMDFVKALPLVDTVTVSRQEDEYETLFEDNIKGLSIYETGEKEHQIREAYAQLTD